MKAIEVLDLVFKDAESQEAVNISRKFFDLLVCEFDGGRTLVNSSNGNPWEIGFMRGEDCLKLRRPGWSAPPTLQTAKPKRARKAKGKK